MRTLLNGVTHLPARQQKLANQMGETFSKAISLNIMEQMSKGHDALAVRVRKGTERLWRGRMATATTKCRTAMAHR